MVAAIAFEEGELVALAGTFRRGRWVDLRDRALLALGVTCPARVSEMLVLRESGGTDELGRVAGVWHCRARENKARVAADYEITATAREALAAWLPVRRRSGYRRGDPLFPSLGRREALTRQGAWEMVKRRCKAAGLSLRGHSTHSMKKSAVQAAYDSFLARHAAGEAGVDPLLYTQRFSGHKSLSSLEHYLRPVSAAAKRDAATAAGRKARALLGTDLDTGKAGEAGKVG